MTRTAAVKMSVLEAFQRSICIICQHIVSFYYTSTSISELVNGRIYNFSIDLLSDLYRSLSRVPFRPNVRKSSVNVAPPPHSG